MFSRIVLILLLAAVAQAQGATETQGALVLVKGSVILNGEGGPGVTNVLITDSAHTGGPWATGSDGGFTLLTIRTELLVCRASVFRGNGAGSASHYFVGVGAWGTEQSDKGRALSFHG